MFCFVFFFNPGESGKEIYFEGLGDRECDEFESATNNLMRTGPWDSERANIHLTFCERFEDTVHYKYIRRWRSGWRIGHFMFTGTPPPSIFKECMVDPYQIIHSLCLACKTHRQGDPHSAPDLSHAGAARTVLGVCASV